MSHNPNLSHYISNKFETLQSMLGGKSKPDTRSRALQKEAFFEKFGTRLRQRSRHLELQTKREVTPQDETAETQELFGGTPAPAQVNPSSANGAATVAGRQANHQDVPTESTTVLGTMEADAVEDLYEKVLMEIVHGNINRSDVSEKALFSYTQDVFNMNEKTHEEILKKARVKPASEVHLRVELVEAKLTERPTVSGALNPFVIMYLQSGLPDVVRSTIQENTNNPIWKECFTLPTSENSHENLILEVFHHDCNMTKVTKTVRVCQKYALSCVKPRSSYQKLIGRTSIPVESISSSGLVMWYSLNKTKRTDPQGTIKLKFHFSSAQNKEQAIEQHEMLTKLFLEYELNSSSVARYWWSGKFTAAGEAILNQHAICADLTETEKVLIYWNAYTTVHVTYRVAFGLFQGLLEKICPLVRSNSISPGDLNRFWNGVQLLLPSCLAVIMKLRKRIAGDNDIVKTVTSVLGILGKVESIRETCNIPLFPSEKYEHFKHKLDQNPNISIHDVVLLAVRTGAKKWFDEAVANTMKATFSDEEKLAGSINLIQLLQSDIIRATSYYNNPFKSILDIDYTRELCKQHEASVVVHLKPIVEKMCKGFKKLTIRLDQHNRVGEMDQLDMSTTLFELYIVLRLFIGETDKELSHAHSPDIVNFHIWFSGGIAHWSDVFAMKALARLSHAIDCDTLEAVPGAQPRQSVSAAEFLSIVRQMRAFWEELAWPDPQELNRFLKRSIGDICSCCVYYADRISTKLRPPQDVKTVDATSSLEMVQKCNLVNSNLSILIEAMASLPDDVGYLQVDINANNEHQQLEQILPINGLSSWKTKTLNLMVDRCMAFLKVKMEESLSNFERVKSETENFTSKTSTMIKRDLKDADLRLVEDELWKGITTEISAIIKRSIDKKASIASFGNLKDFYAIIAQAYLPELQDLQDDKILSERLFTIEKQLYLYSSRTRDLIHQYYLACLEAQSRLDEPDRGLLTVRCAFRNDTLEIQMIGAEDIKLPLDFKGTCDSYVKLNLVPGYKFSVTLPKTRTKSKNHSPTYNEKFALKLSEEQRNIPDALLAFNVKVSEMLGLSQRHVGECFIRLDSIPVLECDRDINSIDVQQLFLTMPENIESDCIPVLEYRQNDKEAVQFFKKLKQKLGKAAYTGSVISIF